MRTVSRARDNLKRKRDRAKINEETHQKDPLKSYDCFKE
jgi:hypothetical protein